MRGPKIRTPQNRRQSAPGTIAHGTLDPPSDLTDDARREYERLLGVLREAGLLERVDLAVIAECARVKYLLDQAHEILKVHFDPKPLKMVTALTAQRRGLLREPGLTTSPSRSVIRTPQGSERDPNKSRWTGRLKIS